MLFISCIAIYKNNLLINFTISIIQLLLVIATLMELFVMISSIIIRTLIIITISWPIAHYANIILFTGKKKINSLKAISKYMLLTYRKT